MKITAFLRGMREFRMHWTTHYESYVLLRWYDRGREFAHVITLRRFDR